MDDPNIFHIYVDESSTSEKYFAVGAVLTQKGAAREISTYVDAVAKRHNYRARKELHWSTMERPALYLEVGTQLIRFTQVKPRKMRYKALVVESSKVRRDRASGETKQDIIAKFVFTLVYDLVRTVGTNVRYHVFYDSPDGAEGPDIPTLCSLNNRCKSRLNVAVAPFRSFEFVKSERSRLIQAADILTAAIAYEMNGHHLRAGANLEKLDVFWSIAVGRKS